MHAKGWSRDQAIAYELAHTTGSPEQAALDVDRRIGWPGQGLSYMIGFLEIRVLEDGSVTLGMLRDKLERWARTGLPT